MQFSMGASQSLATWMQKDQSSIPSKHVNSQMSIEMPVMNSIRRRGIKKSKELSANTHLSIPSIFGKCWVPVKAVSSKNKVVGTDI